jgi:methanogenic corrinoid protein MtbC1
MKDLHQRVSQTIQERRREFAEEIVAKQYELQPAFWSAFGEEGRAKSVRDAGYHLSYLAEAINAVDPSLFVDYIDWVRVLFAGLNFSDEHLLATLECTAAVLQKELSPPLAAVAREYLDTGFHQVQKGSSPPPSFVSEEEPLGDLARQYLEALLQGERHRASQLILQAIDEGVSIKDIYLHVFQRSQYEIGRLWQTNQVSVAEEHYVSAATQLVMSQLYPHIFSNDRNGLRLVAACIGGELHEIGIRMVADFFEMEGWDTYYLGANTPPGSIVEAVEARQADVLAISATMTFHVGAVANLIEQVRGTEAGRQAKILVGGYPFNVSSVLGERLGADASAPNAQEAIGVANRLVTNGVEQ